MVMRIDAHQHFWRYSPHDYSWIDESMLALKRDFLPGDLRPELARTGVDATIAVQVRQTLEETRWLLELADEHAFIAAVIGWVDLQADDVHAQLEMMVRHPKLAGIRHIVQSEPDDRFLMRPAFRRGIAALGELKLPYDILIYPKQLTAAIDLVCASGDQPFVLDHLAKPAIRLGAIDQWAADLRRLAQAPNVCCKLSGLVTEAEWQAWTPAQIHPYLDVAFDCFGADRLIMGSDWPVCTLAASYARTVALVTDYVDERHPAGRDAVLGRNAQRIWRLGAAAGTVARMQEQRR